MMWLRAVAAFLLLLSTLHAQAAGLQISQLGYRSPDLLVFVDRGSGAPSLRSSSNWTATAALGTRTLNISSVERWDESSGVAIVVAFDVSGSMRSVNFQTIQQVVSEMLGRLPAGSRAALVTIGAKVQAPVTFGPISAVIDALKGLSANDPETALNEGVLRGRDLAMVLRPDLPLRRMVLLVTDGVDESKKAIGSPEMLAKAESGEVPIFVVAVTKALPRPLQASGLEPLARVARASGGGFIQTTPKTLSTDLKALMSDAMRVDLAVVGCLDCARDGQERRLRVSLTQGIATVSGERAVTLFPDRHAIDPVIPPKIPVEQDPPSSWWQKLHFLLKLALAITISLPVVYFYRKTIVLYINRMFGYVSKKTNSVVVLSAPPLSQPPRSVDSAQLTIDVAEAGRQQVKVTESDTVLGRSKKAAISTEKDSEASNRHAALYVDKGVLMIRDLGSSNGTYLNGTRIVRPEPVHDYDVVRIGRTEIRIYFGLL